MNIDPFYTNPANSGMNYLNQISSTIQPYYQPYIDSGNQALGSLMGQYNTLLTNPDSVISMAGQGFQSSPGYQYDYNQGMNAANEAAAAGGMLGTPASQQQAASMSENLANQDYNSYLDNSLGLYKTGLQGMGGINQLGYNASNEMAGSLASALTDQAGMAYKGQANQNAANANTMSAMISGLTSFL